MKSILLALAIIASVPLYAAKEKALDTPPAQISYRISVDDMFTVIPKKGWKLYPKQELILRFGCVLIRGPKDVFSLQLNFICDTPDLAKFDTPEKMQEIQKGSCVQFYAGSVERQMKIKYYSRKFTPAGRFGYVARFTDKKYQGNTPVPPEEWKYITVGICRLSKDSVLGFSLLTNSIDDPAYVDLLDYIGAFVIPEPGEKGWKVADAAQAYKIAATKFAKRYQADSLLTQMPYSVKRDGTKWIVDGNMWELMPGGCAHAEIDGPSGKILKIVHYK